MGVTISDESKRCLDLFKELSLAVESVSGPYRTDKSIDHDKASLTLEDAKARFRAWGTNIAAFHDSTQRTSLDARLKEAPEMSSRALRILGDLQDNLAGCKSAQYIHLLNIADTTSN